MSKYTTRVQLIDADSDDYDTLYEEMEKEGFSKAITNGDGVKYDLPDAEYNIDSTLDSSTILNKAKIAAEKTGNNYRVLVTKSAGRKWYNLEKV